MFAEALSLAVATGQPICGMDTTEGPVVYIDLENPKPILVQRFQRLSKGMGIAETAPVVVKQPGARMLPISEQSSIKYLHQICQAHKPTLLIVDTLIACLLEKEENDSASIRRIFNVFRSLAETYDMGVVVLHHFCKPSWVPAAGYRIRYRWRACGVVAI